MTLFEQWELINYIANKDYGGNVIEPEQFNALTKVVNLDLLKAKFGLPEDYQPGAPISRQYLDATQRLTDETRFLKMDLRDETLTPETEVPFTTWAYPSDYFSLVSLLYNYQRNIDGVTTIVPQQVEILTKDEADSRLGNWTKKPSATNPIAVITSSAIRFYPIAIGTADISYIRYPTDPVFDYVEGAGFITEGASPVEYEWPKHLHMDLTRMILSYIGINMREQQLEQYAEQHKAQGV